MIVRDSWKGRQEVVLTLTFPGVFVATSEAVVAFEAASGVPQWRTEISASAAESVEAICWKGDAGSDVVTTVRGAAWRFDGSTGRVLWRATLHDG